MTEREAFEKWFDSVWDLDEPEMWIAWQAARAPLLLETEQLKAELEEGK